MNLEPAPRLNKLVFFSIDAGLVVTAVLIVYFTKNPYAPLPFVTAVACVLLAAIIGIAPVISEFIAENRDYVQEERNRVTDQVQRLHVAAESLARAAAQIKAVEEAVHKTAHAAENLPYRMQEKLAEFNEALAGKEEGDREALEQELTELRAVNSQQLKAVAEKIQKAATDWAALETASRKQLAAAEAALARVQAATADTVTLVEGKLAATLAALDTKTEVLKNSPAALSAGKAPSAPATAIPANRASPISTQPEPEKSVPTSIVESVAVVETKSPVAAKPEAEDAKPKKARVPRKPRPEDVLTAMSEPSPSATESGSGPRESPFPESANETSEPTPMEASVSSDGATRLLATAYIGIGNKLFIRGDGPGLSWERGTPMQFVSIGKWGWATHDATAPVRCKFYKNDETAAVSGEVVLEPGKHVEVTALF